MKQTMLSRVRAYLVRRRALGYKLRAEGILLLNFARYADHRRHRGPMTRALALSWAGLTQGTDPTYRARRLDTLRVFARHQVVIEPSTQIPQRHVFGSAHSRKTPHLYTAAQLRLLLGHASKLAGQLRPQVYRTLIGLLACTGLRISEALALTVNDVDLNRGVISVGQSKYQHSRLVPLHPSALPPLRRYTRARQRKFPDARHFFVSDYGLGLDYFAVRRVFRKLTRHMVPNNTRANVRLHDLRHTFACRVLQRWQRLGLEEAGRMNILSHYLGHAHLRHTYWYLTSTSQLLERATQRSS